MTRYQQFLAVLHRLLAAMIIGALIMGSNVLATPPNIDPAKMLSLKLHMGVCIAILGLMLIRLAVRIFTAKPPKADAGNAALKVGATAAHWGLILLVFAMCASGLAIANTAGLPAIVFGGSGEPLPTDFSQLGPRITHALLAKLLMALVFAHVAGFVYHQFVRKDRLMLRMWFGNRQG